MQIAHLPRAPFRAALASIIKAVPRKDPHPILSTVLIEERDGAVILRATDLAMEASAVITGAVAPVGFATCLPARQLRDAEKNAPGGEDAVITVDGSGALVAFGALTLRMVSRDPQDFPRMQELAEPVAFTMPRAALREALAATEFAISTEETRYYLNGVFMQPTPAHERTDSLRFVSTDGHRMAVHDSALEGAPQFDGVIIRRDTVALLLPLLKAKGAPAAVSVRFSRERIEFTCGAVVVRSKLIDGTFPDYGRCVPRRDDGNTRATLDRRATIMALKALLATGDRRRCSVGFSFDPDGLALWTASEDGGAQASVACDVAGPALDIGFNGRYLLEILGAMSDDVVTIEMQDAGAPARIEGQSGGLYVLMPMRVGWRPARPAAAAETAPATCPAPAATPQDEPDDDAPAPAAAVVAEGPAAGAHRSGPDGAPRLVVVASIAGPPKVSPPPTEAMSGAPRPPTGGASCTRRRPDTTRAAGAGLRMAHPPGGGALCAAPPPTEEIRRRAAAPMAAALDARLAGPPMPPRKVVTLGDVRRIPLGVYVAAWRLVRAAPPDARFRGSPCGWSGSEETAAEILRQFRAGMDDRINRHVPWHGRGLRWGPDWQSEAARLARAVNTPRLVVRWAPQEFRRRLAHRLEDAS